MNPSGAPEADDRPDVTSATTDAFVLYNRQESNALDRVIGLLEEQGVSTHFSRQRSQIYPSELLDAQRLASTRTVLVFLGSEGWGHNQREIAQSLLDGNKPLIPVLIGDPTPAAMDELRGLFRSSRVRDLRKGNGVAELAAEILSHRSGEKFASSAAIERDNTDLNYDGPAAIDLLGRRALAHALAIRLDALVQEQSAGEEASLAIQLHAPWGAGKTSFMKLFSAELTSLTASRWVPVWFNAWENHRVEQPWWLLYQRLFDAVQARAVQRPPRGARKIPARVMLRVRETFWRLTVGNRDNLALSAIGVVVLCVTSLLQWPFGKDLDSTAKTLATLVGLATTAGGVLRAIANGLLGGGSRAAQGFVEAAQDPMSLLRKHYKRLLDSFDVKLIAFIDDLDRCFPAYVVHILEGIQTHVAHPQVCWMVAADRRWLAHSFEAAFPGLTPEFKDLAEPGNRFGYLFVEKAFQLFMTLPELRGSAKEDYWNKVVKGPPAATPDRKPSEIFTANMSEVDILAALAARTEADPGGANAYRQEAVRRLASQEAEESVRHFLTPFTGLIRSNPRAMKRLANSYTIFRDVAILSGIQLKPGEGQRHELARWTILAMDAPSLLDALEQSPSILINAQRGELPSDLPRELEPLWLKPRIQSLLFGQPEQQGLALSALTSDQVLEFAVLRGERL